MNPLPQQFQAVIGISLTESSKTAYSNALKSFLGRFDNPAKVKTADVLEWIQSEISAGNSNSTVRFKLGVIQRFYRWLVDEGHVKHAPKFHTLPKLPKAKPAKVPFTEEQFRRVLNVCEMDNHPDYLRAACVVGWHTGLRLSDICLLQRSAINFDDGIIRLVAQKKKRFNEAIEIPISEELRTVLLAELNSIPATLSTCVFPVLEELYTRRRTTLEEQFRRLFDAAALPNHSFHSWRHAFVSRLLNRGVSHLIIMQITGHSAQQIATYSHVSMDAKRQAMGISFDATSKFDNQPNQMKAAI